MRGEGTMHPAATLWDGLDGSETEQVQQARLSLTLCGVNSRS